MAEIVSQYRIEVKQAVDALNQVADATEGSGKKVKKSADDSAKALAGVKDVASQISPEFGRAANAMSAFRGGIGKVVTAMKTLRGAIIATGIGALLVAIGSLVSYFTQTESGAQRLKVAMAAVGAAVNTVRDAMFGLMRAGAAFLRGDFKEAAEQAANAFKGMGDRIKENVAAAIELEKRSNALRISERDLSVEMAKRRAEINELRLAAEDENKTVAQRIQLLTQADEIEKRLMDERIRNAEENLAIITAQNELSENATKDFEAQAQAEINLANIREESNQRQRRLLLQLNSLRRQAASDEKARQDELIKAQDQLTKEQEKANAERLKQEQETQAAIEKAEAEHAKRIEEIRKGLASLTLAIDEELNTASEDLLRRQVAAIKQTQLERQAVLMQSLQNQLITIKEYEKAAIDTDAAAKATIEAAEREHQKRLQKTKDEANKIAAAKQQQAQQNALDVMQAGLSTLSNIYASVAQMAEQTTRYELQMLRDRFEDGEITREEYYAKEKQLQRESAQRAKDAATFQAIIGAAQAALNALSTVGVPFPVALAFSLFAAAQAAVQVAAIQSAPIPRFEQGGPIKGKRHYQGGEFIEAEAGEYVVNRKATAKNYELIEAINKGMGEAYIMRKWVAPAVDSALLNGWQDVGRSAELNGLTATLKDHNIIRAMDRNREATTYGLTMVAGELKRLKSDNSRKAW